ncbi:MAG: sensor histidine kinase [Cyanobacteria bacterium P01_G01_bin.67]
MKYFNRLKANPLRLLLYLEWILFVISMFAEFWVDRSTFPLFINFPSIFPELIPQLFPLSILLAIAFLVMGIWQPQGKWWENASYIGLGFVLIGLIGITGNASVRLLPPLLLIMVIRGCLCFNLSGSIIVAATSLTWFFVSLFFTLNERLKLPGIQQISAIITSDIQPDVIYQLYSNEEQLKLLIHSMATNISFLFCLISVFVFLLVNALKAEYFSRSELKLANEQLREYALLIEDRAMLQERNRIAQEIHDSLGHSLTAQNIQLANALMHLRSDPDNSEQFLSEAKQLGSNALQEVRQSVTTLRYDPLKGKLISEAIAELVSDFQHRTEIAFNYQCLVAHRLPQKITTTVYRIVQEALTNIIKHAEATEVDISLQILTNQLEIRVEDNGIGFDPLENTTGFGIQGMGERTKALGGKFKLVSEPEIGCKISATIPLVAKLDNILLDERLMTNKQ